MSAAADPRWLPLHRVRPRDRARVGGKAVALAGLQRSGVPVPRTLCLTVEAYRAYVDGAGLRAPLALELARRDPETMRWEEMWDTAQRIRRRFLSAAWPVGLREELRSRLDAEFGDAPLAVRSSAPAEDGADASFAGLHESHVHVLGADAAVERVRQVWASLWSDGALLYRRELGLDVDRAAMAVVVQRLVEGERSGVAFSASPQRADEAVIEAVWGLNQGLVDGTVDPDRWHLARPGGQILRHIAPPRRTALGPAPRGGVTPVELPAEQAARAPLEPAEVASVHGLASGAEAYFGSPQDVEWTWRGGGLVALQSRPVTTAAEADRGSRAWQLGLRRSQANLEALGARIEQQHLPAMDAEAEALAAVDLAGLDDGALAAELDRRVDALLRWTDVYWDEFIPFAHGARLFGQVYNDAVGPDDDAEYLSLLAGTAMASLRRNRALEALARDAAGDAGLLAALGDGDLDAHPAFVRRLHDALEVTGELSSVLAGDADVTRLGRLVAQLARRGAGAGRGTPPDVDTLRARFLDSFEPGEPRRAAADLLALARRSYRLRDDDNLHLGRIEARLADARAEADRRLRARRVEPGPADDGDRAAALRDPTWRPAPRPSAPAAAPDESPTASAGSRRRSARARARQLVGQPAGRGLVTAPARVVTDPADLFEVRAGEVLVVDSIDPNMTFVVPVCGGIVERRGGMLVHGAIIAREYGLPCVTGVDGATQRIATGDVVTVDGYLGIVVIRPKPEPGG